MSTECHSIHQSANNLERYSLPFEERKIPLNGIYLLFQNGESGHQGDRIVRVGTHTGDNNLRKRLKEHFLIPKKDRSIFRKNIGRALLNQNNDQFLAEWEIDLTKKKDKEKYLRLIDSDYQKQIEKQVSDFIQNNFSFCVFEVLGKKERLDIKSKLISTISRCTKCKPSSRWLGNQSPEKKIVESGLWQVQHLYKTQIDDVSIKKYII